MKNNIIITMGVPGSGKTFWSKEFQKENIDLNIVRISNDELRESLFGRIFDARDSNRLYNMREAITLQAIKDKENLLIDNCNVSIKYVNLYERYAKDYNLELYIKDFSSVPIELCLERNLSRGREVPENVIRNMHKEMIKTKELIKNQNFTFI